MKRNQALHAVENVEGFWGFDNSTSDFWTCNVLFENLVDQT